MNISSRNRSHTKDNSYGEKTLSSMDATDIRCERDDPLELDVPAS